MWAQEHLSFLHCNETAKAAAQRCALMHDRHILAVSYLLGKRPLGFRPAYVNSFLEFLQGIGLWKRPNSRSRVGMVVPLVLSPPTGTRTHEARWSCCSKWATRERAAAAMAGPRLLGDPAPPLLPANRGLGPPATPIPAGNPAVA